MNECCIWCFGSGYLSTRNASYRQVGSSISLTIAYYLWRLFNLVPLYVHYFRNYLMLNHQSFFILVYPFFPCWCFVNCLHVHVPGTDASVGLPAFAKHIQPFDWSKCLYKFAIHSAYYVTIIFSYQWFTNFFLGYCSGQHGGTSTNHAKTHDFTKKMLQKLTPPKEEHSG